MYDNIPLLSLSKGSGFIFTLELTLYRHSLGISHCVEVIFYFQTICSTENLQRIRSYNYNTFINSFII